MIIFIAFAIVKIYFLHKGNRGNGMDHVKCKAKNKFIKKRHFHILLRSPMQRQHVKMIR